MTTASGPPVFTRPRCTVADLVSELGDVPAERILIDPLPGTATETDLLHKLEVEKHLCELIDGTLVEKPMGWYESILAMLLGQELLNFIRPRRLGACTGESGPWRFKIGLVRLPDVAFVSAERIRAAGGVRNQPIPSVIPELAVEILSPGNRPREMKKKRQEYFDAGVKLVWIIDPKTRTADVYTSVENPARIQPDGVLTGDDALPGFELRLAELFAEADTMAHGLA